MAEVIMPRLSDTMEEGTVSRWLKQPGEQVETGEVIAEIETDKATMELEAFESGVLQQILVPEGETVPIGQTIAMIGEGTAPAAVGAVPATASAPDAAAHPEPAQAGAATGSAAAADGAGAQTRQPAPVAPHSNGRSAGGRIFVTPVARSMSEELGVDLSRVHGTGPGGRIIKQNIEDYLRSAKQAPAAKARPTLPPAQQRQAEAEAATAPPAAAVTPAQPAAVTPPAQRPPQAAASAQAGAVEPLSRIRRAVARSMTESKPGVPHIYVTSEIEMSALLRLRKEINEGGSADVKISVNDLIVKAVALALRKSPALNSSFATGADGQPGVIRHEQVNVSVAVALDDGLVAPVVKDADKKSVSAIAGELHDLAARAREGKLRQPEIEGATFQVSNLGMFDVLAFVSVITPPQAASLAVGSVRRTPVVRDDGRIEGAEMMQVVLSSDHRVTDGATSARFLQELKRLLQTPMRLLV